MFKKFKKTPKISKESGDWSKNDEKVLQSIEAGDIGKLQSALTKRGTSAAKFDPEGRSALHLAAKVGQFDCLNVILQLGVDLSLTDPQGRSSLHWAARSGHADCVQRLIQFNAPLELVDNEKLTALHHAAIGGHLHCVVALLQNGADVDPTDKNGRTPLCLAAQLGHTTLCKEFLDKGANLNTKDIENRTPLMIASEHGNKDVVQVFLRKGAIVGLTDDNGFDAAYYAEINRHNSVLECLSTAPSVASWDVGQEEEEEHVPEYTDDINEFQPPSVDDVDDTDGEEEMETLPVSSLANQVKSKPPPLQHETSTEDYMELEEENEMLNEELNKINMQYKKALEKIHLFEKAQSSQGLNSSHSTSNNDERNQGLEKEIQALQKNLGEERRKRQIQLDEINLLKSQQDAKTEADEKNKTESDDDSWGDSDEDLFDLPENGSAIKNVRTVTVKSANAKKTEEGDKQLVALLRSQIVSLRLENDELKSKLEGNLSASSSEMAKDVAAIGDDHLKRAHETEVTRLQASIKELEESLIEAENRSMVPVDEYEELKSANQIEVDMLQKRIAHLEEEVTRSSENMADLMEENSKLVDRMNGLSNSADSTNQLSALLGENRDLKEIIRDREKDGRQKEKEISEYREKLEGQMRANREMEEQYQRELKTLSDRSVVASEFDELSAENSKLQNTLSKQSRAIAQQNEKARRDKQTIAELSSEKEALSSRCQEVEAQNSQLREEVEQRSKALSEHAASDHGRVSELLEEKARLEETLEKQSEMLSSRPPRATDHSKVNELFAENLQLQDMVDKQTELLASQQKQMDELLLENQVLEETVQKQDQALAHTEGSLKEYDSMAERCQGLGVQVGQLEGQLEEALAQNQWLGEESQEGSRLLAEKEAAQGEAGRQRQQLLAEKGQLQELLERKTGSLTSEQEAGRANREKAAELELDNRRLRETVQRQSAALAQRSPAGGQGSAPVETLQKQLARYQKLLAETEIRHRDAINTYRTHLLDAVRGTIDRDVKKALLEIVKLRNQESISL